MASIFMSKVLQEAEKAVPGTVPAQAPLAAPSQTPTNGPSPFGYNPPAPNVQQPAAPAPYTGPAYVGTPANSNTQGFVQGKLDDPSLGTTHKYVGGRYLVANPGDIAGMLRLPEFQGWTQVSGDKIKSPQGSIYDARNANGAVQWTYISGGPGMRNDGIPGNYAASLRGGAAPTSNSYLDALKTDGIPGNYKAAVAAGVTGGGQASLPPSGGPIQSSYAAQFSDPATAQLEQYLQAQMQALEGQRTQQQQANTGLQGQMAAAGDSSEQLVQYLTQQAARLRQPAYTGTEQEVLRTQALDPIERDRTAANQRALENIGSRGFDPTSGIAQELIGQTNRGFDERRADAQGDLAYRQITEQRSRDQEAQSLLAAIPQVQSADAAQQLQFMQALDAALNAPRQQGLNLSQMLYRLPAQAQNDALAAMNMGGSSPDSIFQNAMGLYNAQNQQANQGLGYYQMLGSLLPYLMGNG